MEERQESERAFASDGMPFVVLALLVAAFFAYFGATLADWPSPLATLPGMAARDVADGMDSERVYDLEICNHTKTARVYVSVAYFDRALKDWVARGWYPQDQGACNVTLQHVMPPVFVYGENRDGHDRWGDGTPRGRTFCIDGHGAFVRGQGAAVHCAEEQSARTRLQRFQELAPPAAGGRYTWDLTE